MDHSLKAKVNLAGADDFGDILDYTDETWTTRQRFMRSYTRVIGLQKSDLDSFILEVAFGLSQVHGRMVRRRMPVSCC